MGPHLQLPQCQEFSIKVFHHKGWLIKALLVGPRKAPGQHAPDGWSMEAEGFHITYQEFGQKETLHFFICPLNATRTQITSNNKEFGSGFHVFFVSLSPPTECYWKNTTPTLVLQIRPKWTYPQHCQGY